MRKNTRLSACTNSISRSGAEEQWRSQDEQVTWAQHGYTQYVRNTHLLGDLGHAPAMKNFKIIHSEIASEAVFGHKYNSFRLTCMVASCKHETYPGTSEFYVGTGPGMPGCSYTTAEEPGNEAT